MTRHSVWGVCGITSCQSTGEVVIPISDPGDCMHLQGFAFAMDDCVLAALGSMPADIFTALVKTLGAPAKVGPTQAANQFLRNGPPDHIKAWAPSALL
eukprot:scaffold498173_cov37-Prasinocladus_malaysianus.AAC.1